MYVNRSVSYNAQFTLLQNDLLFAEHELSLQNIKILRKSRFLCIILNVSTGYKICYMISNFFSEHQFNIERNIKLSFEKIEFPRKKLHYC